MLINTRYSDTLSEGFTLIELSIVLVIIGLIVGGVLVGQDLIKASYVRAQISQIEKYNTIVNTFRGKYDALPGDLTNDVATQYGFAARGPNPAQGDGNGILQGWIPAAGFPSGDAGGAGETTMFWVDLTQAKLIDGSFTTATSTTNPPSISGTSLSLYFPESKLGAGLYVYAYSGGYCEFSNLYPGDGVNYYGLSAIRQIYNGGFLTGTPGMTVQQAYNIDRKTDDGMPQSGRVIALFMWVGSAGWAAGTAQSFGVGTGGAAGATACNSNPVGPTTAATAASSTTCYDNAGAVGPQQYSMGQNQGMGLNCALSFKFQ